MTEFASAEWVAALDSTMSAVDPGPAAAALEGFVLQQVVTGVGADDEVAWTVSVDSGRVRVRPGRAAAPDVTLTTDAATGAAVASGDESAQAAFMAGRLRIGGDPTALVRVQPLLAAVGGASREATQGAGS